MAVVTVPDLDQKFEDRDEIRQFLASRRVDYEFVVPDTPVAPDAPAEELLTAYQRKIDLWKAQGGYVTADVIDVFPHTAGLAAMLTKFSSEHWHAEDEVRFIVEGRGVFHVHPEGQPVFAVEVGPGDLIRVPAGIHHWFDLCGDRRIRAIRLFKDPAGWSPNYTQTGVDERFQPVCFGPAYVPAPSHDMWSALGEHGVRLVLLDIEGTTTPIAFVYDVLFPFVRARMPAWLTAHVETADFAAVQNRLRAEHAVDTAHNQSPPPWHDDTAKAVEASVCVYAAWLMDRDRKSPGLKLLQGFISDEGYRAGELRGEVYPDVPVALRRWAGAGLGAAIYSSGSELAQRRLFSSTVAGDLTPLLAGFFDTAVGAKNDPDSYRRIAGALGYAPEQIVFVSDVTRELRAARHAGCQVRLSLRPANPPQPDAAEFMAIASFDELP